MSDIKFVIQSSTAFHASAEHKPPTHKRSKRACLGCHSRKARCSGTQPCRLCQSRGIECVYAEPNTTQSKAAKKVANAASIKKRKSRKNDARVIEVFSSAEQSYSNDPRISQTPVPDTPSSSLSANGIPNSLESNNVLKKNQEKADLKNRPVLTNRRHSSITRYPYFRWLGPTAIAPPKSGIFRLLSVNMRASDDGRKSVIIERNSSSLEKGRSSTDRKTIKVDDNTLGIDCDGDSDANLNQASDMKYFPPKIKQSTDDYDFAPPLPPIETYRLYLNNMANYLPYLPADIFEDRFSEGLISECLLYAIASLAEKLNSSNPPQIFSSKHENGLDGGASDTGGNCTPVPTLAERYAETAKRLVLPHLASPSAEIVYTLLLIAYSEFGEDRDSGLWAWSGMAIRMCYDLGLHKKHDEADSVEHAYETNVFWSVVCLDRLISCGTGRMSTVPEKDIEHECEFGTITGADGIKISDPFPYLCRLLILLGRVSDYINTHPNKATNDSSPAKSSNSPGPLSPDSWGVMETFTQFQNELFDFYTSLPSDLLFDVQNFQQYSKINYSQVFLLLHIWNQTLVLAAHHRTIAYPFSKLDVAGLIYSPLAGTGSISIADMAAFADLINADSFLASPFLSQPLYISACASLTLWHNLPDSAPSHTIHTLQRTYSTCRQILQRMQRIWRGISWHRRSLDALAASEPDVDLSVGSKSTVITRDLGAIRKASVDESTRRWLLDEIGDSKSDYIYGMLISGLTDEFAAQNDQQDQSRNLVTNDAQTSVQLSKPSSDSSVADKNEYRLPSRRTLSRTTSDNVYAHEDTFKSMLIRNLDLEEYFRPVNF